MANDRRIWTTRDAAYAAAVESSELHSWHSTAGTLPFPRQPGVRAALSPLLRRVAAWLSFRALRARLRPSPRNARGMARLLALSTILSAGTLAFLLGRDNPVPHGPFVGSDAACTASTPDLAPAEAPECVVPGGADWR